MNTCESLSYCHLDARHMLGRVHSLDTFSAVDGPGTRSVVFLQGCMFRCLYCQNRDTWDMAGGTLYSATELIEEMLPYKGFMKATGGGVTVSGGEPLLQREFVREFFHGLHYEGIHTALDTNGYMPGSHYDGYLEKLLEHTDLILLDIKHMDPVQHEKVTGMSNAPTLKFARHLAEIGQAVWIRYVVVPGLTDQPENAEALAEFLSPMPNVQRIELLPFHQLGAHKWQLMGDQYRLSGIQPPTPSRMRALAEPLQSLNLTVTWA